MEFIRRVGGQAEVNDGGKIRRLPFSGEGVAPQPGAKVNPVRDACCCPGAVPLEPNRVKEESLRSDPRRVSKQNPANNKTLWMLDTFSYFRWVGQLPLLKDFKGKFALIPVDTLYLPLVDRYIMWEPKTNKISVIEKSEVQKYNKYYIWSEGSFGSVGNFTNQNTPETIKGLRTSWEYGIRDLLKGEKFTKFKDMDFFNPLKSRKITVKVFDAYSSSFPEFSDKGIYAEIIQPGPGYKSLFNDYLPGSKLFVTTDRDLQSYPPRKQGVNPTPADIAQFLEWYKDPDNPKYKYALLPKP